jgi:fatty acid synthase subunit alpha
MLVGRYIPNLIAKPFEDTREYAQIIYDQTSSPRLDKVLRKWDEEEWGSAEQRQQLAYLILVEFLAYQFASPVRWIETQDLLFTVHDFERYIEIGPSPTLTGMATRTLKTEYEAGDDSVSRTRIILCHAKHTKEVYYQFDDDVAAESVPEPDAASTPAPIVAVQTPVASTATTTPTAAATNIEDAPIRSLKILTVIIAQKLKKPANEVPLSKFIKDLVGGKSTLQNEILGDLGQEFSSAPEKGEELGTALGVGFSASIQQDFSHV